MKRFMLINAILEITAGILLLCAPTLVPGTEDTSSDGLIFLRMYGGAALAVGIGALVMWQNYDSREFRRLFVILFSVFHTGVTIANVIGYLGGDDQCVPVFVLHGVLAIITLFYFTKHR